MNEKFVEFISEGVNDPGIFKAVFLAGGPGSGKSFMVGKTALSTFGLRTINSDDVFEAALRKAEMAPTPENIYSEKGQSMRSRAKQLTQTKLSLSVIGRLGLVIDGTGKDVSTIQRQATTLKNLGYDVAMIFVNTDLETALQRNNSRSRTLPDQVVKNMWNAVQNNIGSFQRMFKNNLIIVDNSSDSNVDANTLRAYRDIQNFVRQPIRNHKARQWITNKQKQAMREEAMEILGTMEEERKYKVAQDPDIKDRKSSQPAHYHKGLKKGTKVKRDAQFQKQAKMRDDDPKAYKFAPGDKDKGGKLKKTKPSKYTKYVDNMLKKEDTLDEKCWDSHKQVGMKKKGGKMVPNCVPKSEETDENRDSMTLPKIGKMRNVSKRVSKQRTKNKVFDKIKIDEVTMSDKIKAKTVYKDKYKKFANIVLSKVRKDRLTHGGKLRHNAYYHASELLRQYGLDQKMNSKILGDMIKEQLAEEYKYERGTPEGTRYMQAMTPGEPGKTTKKNKTKSKNHYKAVAEDVSNCKYGKYYCNDDKVWKCRQGPKQTREETNEMYKSPAHARLQKMRDKIRTTAKYKADVKKVGGTPLKPGEKANTFIKTRMNEEDGHTCQDGYYWCRQRKACVPIPEGYKDRGDGFIVRENVADAVEHVKDLYSTYLEASEDLSKPVVAEPLDLSITDEDVQDMLNQADNLTIDDMIALGMYTPDEVVDLEDVDPDEIHNDVQVTEALTPLGRIKRRQAARRNKQKLRVARARALRKTATPDKIKMRATRGARSMMYKRLLRGRDKSSLPPSEKARLETMVKRFQPLIARIAVRMVPQMRKNELNRLRKRGTMAAQKAKKFKIAKGGSASKYKAKKFKIK